MKTLITDDYPRKAVWYWGLCVGSDDSDIKVTIGEDGTLFQNGSGAKILFNYVMNFNIPEVYSGGTVTKKLSEWCGFEIGDEDE